MMSLHQEILAGKVNEEFQQQPASDLNVFQKYSYNFKHILKSTCHEKEYDFTEVCTDRGLF